MDKHRWEMEGGPAFPSTLDGEPGVSFMGMSLRDWFAGQALTGITVAAATTGLQMPMSTAHLAYGYADAMLAERSKAQGGS